MRFWQIHSALTFTLQILIFFPMIQHFSLLFLQLQTKRHSVYRLISIKTFLVHSSTKEWKITSARENLIVKCTRDSITFPF